MMVRVQERDALPSVVHIAVGANIDPEENIPKALALLASKVQLTAVSTFYRTEPLERPEQPPFLNGACTVVTLLPPRELKFGVLRAIEEQLGRVRTADAYAPRRVDFDIALYGGRVVREKGLEIPDPDIRRRAFLAVPLLELAPDVVMPDTGEPLVAIVEGLDREGLLPEEAFTRELKARLTR